MTPLDFPGRRSALHASSPQPLRHLVYSRALPSLPIGLRRVSSSIPQPADPKPPSPHRSFYKQFGRPIAKVLTGAFLTYQILYWTWMKLETDELKAKKQKEVSALESQARALVEPQLASRLLTEEAQKSK